eukprot:scaffold16277_cov57-Phaeocystis_antarctica.AAC.2
MCDLDLDLPLASGAASLARPVSARYATRFSSRKILSGLKSRCQIERACRYSSASSAWPMIFTCRHAQMRDSLSGSGWVGHKLCTGKASERTRCVQVSGSSDDVRPRR